jgi:NAD(P)-dependent dehydrogenase (short-subunit alcohol dehydrogenase family)
MARLEGRTALITGAGLGIGKGLARRFAREGANVMIGEWNDDAGQKAAEEVRGLGVDAQFIHCDVGVQRDVEAAVAATVERWGAIDILVNNAWSGPPMGRVEWKTTEEMEKAFRVGFLGNFWAMQAAFPHMKARGWGRIINMCSLNGVNAHMYTVHYNMAKEAVRSLSRTAAREWARHNVLVNVICPAAMTESSKAVMEQQPEMMESIRQTHPMGRMGDPEEDIGGAALFLASDDCRYVTGNTLFVDGGSHINGSAWAPDMPEEMPG